LRKFFLPSAATRREQNPEQREILARCLGPPWVLGSAKRLVAESVYVISKAGEKSIELAAGQTGKFREQSAYV
jgi:hypothetical protein